MSKAEEALAALKAGMQKLVETYPQLLKMSDIGDTFEQLGEATAQYRRGNGQPAADAFQPKKTPPPTRPQSDEQDPPAQSN